MGRRDDRASTRGSIFFQNLHGLPKDGASGTTFDDCPSAANLKPFPPPPNPVTCEGARKKSKEKSMVAVSSHSLSMPRRSPSNPPTLLSPFPPQGNRVPAGKQHGHKWAYGGSIPYLITYKRFGSLMYCTPTPHPPWNPKFYICSPTYEHGPRFVL